MIIKNNKHKGQYFRYKVNGKVLKIYIAGDSYVDIPDLTDIHEVFSNTYERRLRHIEEDFGYNFKTAFEIPGDPDFIAYIIESSASVLGTITPLGSIKIAQGENAIFNMSPNPISFGINSSVSGTSGGTISPSNNNISSNAYNYLSALNIDGNANQLSAATGNVSATTQYTFENVFSSHTISATFSLAPGSKLFTMMPNSDFYLKTLTVNGLNQVSGVTGNISGASTYTITNVISASTIVALFKPYGE